MTRVKYQPGSGYPAWIKSSELPFNYHILFLLQHSFQAFIPAFVAISNPQLPALTPSLQVGSIHIRYHHYGEPQARPAVQCYPRLHHLGPGLALRWSHQWSRSSNIDRVRETLYATQGIYCGEEPKQALKYHQRS